MIVMNMTERFKHWDILYIRTKGTARKSAVAPVIISASRSTDIPAYYAPWFVDQLRKGYVPWKNPFNQRIQYVSFARTRVIVFWTKNPEPLIPLLPLIDKTGVHYYFQYTLNDYEKEDLERDLPPLKKRINTFKALSTLIGKEKVIWRFDPLILNPELTLERLQKRIGDLGDELHAHTRRLVISFVDIFRYQKVQNNLKREKKVCFEFSPEEMRSLAFFLQTMNRKWDLDIRTCAEKIDLTPYGIRHNKCIDDELMKQLFPEDNELARFLNLKDLKDKGQRKDCLCIPSKDIGQYNTCRAGCTYCYATSFPLSRTCEKMI